MREAVLLLILAAFILPLSVSSQPVIIVDSLGDGLCGAVADGDRVVQYISVCNPDSTLRRMCFSIRFYSPDGATFTYPDPELVFYNDFLSIMEPDDIACGLHQDGDDWVLNVYTFPNSVANPGWLPSPDTITYIGIEFTVEGEGSHICFDSTIGSWGAEWLADPGPAPVFGGEVCHEIGTDVLQQHCITGLFGYPQDLSTSGYCEPISYFIAVDQRCPWLPLTVEVWGPGEAEVTDDDYVWYTFTPNASDFGKTYEVTIYPYDDLCRDGSLLERGFPASFTVTVGTGDVPVGDIDESGEVDISDLQELIYIMFIEPQDPPDPRVCNADCKEGVDITDVSVLVDHLFLTLTPLCGGC
ncbi:MAG: hypothetical protein GY841_14485 [FCB group bacterium]|nr:hypothetical protein [FCB group bacterium]